jgi:hypothetical protein
MNVEGAQREPMPLTEEWPVTAIRGFSGKPFDGADPESWEFDIEDVARGLSLTCRFGGQLPRFYSVAEHSVIVSSLVEANGGDARTVMAGLLHDAHEAFYGDVPHPFKILVPEYVALMDRFDRALEAKIGLTTRQTESDLVVLADRSAFMDEWEEFFGSGDEITRGMGPEESRIAFLARYSEVKTRMEAG